METAMREIFSSVQNSAGGHNKYSHELRRLYEKADHKTFVLSLIQKIKACIAREQDNECAANVLTFCANYISSLNGKVTHPVFVDVLGWLLDISSPDPHIRFRLCEFITMTLNALPQEISLDDPIYGHVTDNLLELLRHPLPKIRAEAVLALKRFQTPDDPNDPVIAAYIYQMSSDPSELVRKQVITCISRNGQTIPHIMERMSDIDDKVRRHTYIHMSNYSVISLKVDQRLVFLEQGLNDRSESVRKAVTNIMLNNWIASYQRNLIKFIGALKMVTTASEMGRFKNITKLMLHSVFKTRNEKDLSAQLPLEKEGEFSRCVPHDRLTIEVVLYWQCLVEHFVSIKDDEYVILPELSSFCEYVERYKLNIDSSDRMVLHFIVLSLIDILSTYDLDDDFGRRKLQQLITHLLKEYTFDERIIQVIVNCARKLITKQDEFLEYFKNIILDTTLHEVNQNDLSLTTKFMNCTNETTFSLKESSILEFASQEKSVTMDPIPRSVMKTESVLQSLQITFYMLISENWKESDPILSKVYNDFICGHLGAKHKAVRDWALQCATAYAMINITSARDVFKDLRSQFSNSSSVRLWVTATSGIFELLDKYGIEHFTMVEEFSDMRTLHDEPKNSSANQGTEVLSMMCCILATCDDLEVKREIVVGFCRLLLHGRTKNRNIIEKIFLVYFNPKTEPELHQRLSVFIQEIVARRLYYILETGLMPTIMAVLGATKESPQYELRADTITKFFLDATRTDSKTRGGVHNKFALIFLQEMLVNVNNAELSKLLSKEILALEVDLHGNNALRNDLKKKTDELLKIDFEARTANNLKKFRQMLGGVPKEEIMDTDCTVPRLRAKVPALRSLSAFLRI